MTRWNLLAANFNPDALWVYEALERWLAERDVGFDKAGYASDGELIDRARTADILLAYKYRVNRDVIAALPGLKLIMASGSGYDHIDVDAATEHGVIVANAARHNVEDVAEHTLALLLACARKLPLLQAQVRSGQWRPPVQPVYRLRGKTLGLIGFGNIARAVAWRALGLGLRVTACSRSVPEAAIQAQNVEPLTQDALLRDADFVSLHLISTVSTRGVLGAPELRSMKPTAYLINTSRGDLVDEAALIRALREGWIAGAGLDVLAQEPSDPTHPLLAMDNVLVTGHSAASTVEAPHDWLNEWFETLGDFLTGTWPAGVVNPGVVPKVTLKRRSER